MRSALGAAVFIYSLSIYCSTLAINLNTSEPTSESEKITDFTRDLNPKQEPTQFNLLSIKSTIKNIIKYYRIVKPELHWMMCFSQYAGIVESGREMKTSEAGTGALGTLRELVRNIVRAVKFFISDITPQPMANMMKTATEMWDMTREMYTAMKKDEMGHCSLDYMSKRFWWWIGV